MKAEIRTPLGFLAASVVPAAYLAIAFPLSGQHDPASVMGTFVVVYYFSALATGLLGLPAFLLLSRLKLVTWWSSIACGALAGGISLFVMVGNTQPAVVPFRFVALGSVSGLLFWLVWNSGPARPASEDVV